MRKAIGRQVHGDITDLLEPLYGYTVPKVVPSILPPHDDTTIGRLANTQRALRRSDLSPESQALVLDEVERIELWIQKEDRPPRPPPSIFDGEPQVSYFIQ
ncbi:MAG: hypothetical protein KBC47_02055 [Candidatus Peribacteraceae bacterium]|nr:hypothetical protein [Candidatus Peribacteraceae bacterium]